MSKYCVKLECRLLQENVKIEGKARGTTEKKGNRKTKQIKTDTRHASTQRGMFCGCLGHPVFGDTRCVAVLRTARLLLVARRNHLDPLLDDVLLRRERVAEVLDGAQVQSVVAQASVLLPPVLLEAALYLAVRHLLDGAVRRRPERNMQAVSGLLYEHRNLKGKETLERCDEMVSDECDK